MTPDQYWAKWNLPVDYPTVAPAYAERDAATLPERAGFGRRHAVPEPQPVPVAKKRGRPKATA
jgi:predicted transcriptional regulator